MIAPDIMSICQASDGDDSIQVTAEQHELPHDFSLMKEDKFMEDQTALYFVYHFQGKKSRVVTSINNEVFVKAEHDQLLAVIHYFCDNTYDQMRNLHQEVHEKVWEYTKKAIFDFVIDIFQEEMGKAGLPIVSPESSVSPVPGGMSVNSFSNTVSNQSRLLPGVNSKVDAPCECEGLGKSSLWGLIQHLNDDHDEWAREKIADWLDELHDNGEINIEFQPWGEEPVDQCEDDELSTSLEGWKEVGYTVAEHNIAGELAVNLNINIDDALANIQKAASKVKILGEELNVTTESIEALEEALNEMETE